MVQHIQLKDICDVLNGYAFKSSKYVDEGIRVIRITNVQKGYIEDNAPQYYPLECEKEIEKYLLREDDLLMSLTGNVGRVAILKKEMLPAALNQRVACLRLKSSANIYKPYLFHLLNSDFFENQCIFSAQGIAQKNMSTEWLKEYQIPLYSTEKQKDIADLFDQIDALIQDRKEQQCKLDELVKSRFIELFGDIITNSKNWNTSSWNEVLKIVNGKNQKTVESETGDYLICGSGGPMGRATDYLTDENSVIVGRKGNINKPILMREKYWNVDTAFGIEPNESVINVEYLYMFCLFFNFERLNKAVTIPSLTKADLLEIKMPIPPMKLQQQFAAFVTQVDKSKLAVQKGLQELEILKKSLMQQYFG